MEPFKLLRLQGYRITKQRKKVFECLFAQPISAEGIFKELKKGRIAIDLTSIYRTLQLFVRHSIAQEVDFGDGKKRYERVNEKNHHHHAICNSCGKVKDIALEHEDILLKQAIKDSSFHIEKHSLEFFGLCQSCV